MTKEEVIKERIKMLERSRKNYIHKFKQRQKKKWNDMEQQLQVYKDKEDKLREYIEHYKKVEPDEYHGQAIKSEFDYLLQILNNKE